MLDPSTHTVQAFACRPQQNEMARPAALSSLDDRHGSYSCFTHVCMIAYDNISYTTDDARQHSLMIEQFRNAAGTLCCYRPIYQQTCKLMKTHLLGLLPSRWCHLLKDHSKLRPWICTYKPRLSASWTEIVTGGRTHKKHAHTSTTAWNKETNLQIICRAHPGQSILSDSCRA